MKFTGNLNNEIPSIWNKNEQKILKKIYKLTNLKIATNKITCKIDGSVSDGYYGYKNITLGIKNGIVKDDVLMVITHELFHIFYWRKVRQRKFSKGILGKETKREWQLAEITAYLITKELKSFFPTAKIYIYPETKNLYKKIKKLWNRKNFEYFLRNSYEIILPHESSLYEKADDCKTEEEKEGPE